MPNFKEQLKIISGMRESCRKRDEALYRTSLDLHRTIQQFNRAAQNQTIVDLTIKN